MVERPLPDSEEAEREKEGRSVTRVAWIGFVILAVLLAAFFLLVRR